MKSQFTSLLFVAFIFSCSTSKVATQHKQQIKFIPKEFHNTYLGMPLDEFKKQRKMAELYKDEDFRTVFTEEPENDDIKTVAYYFGKKDAKPLYEYIIDFHSKAKRDEFVAANFGEPNNGDDWIFDSGEGFKIKAWQFQNKLVVVGIIPGTEWYE